MDSQPSGPSSSTRPPLRCVHTSCDHGDGCSPWHYDLLAGDELFTKEDQEHDDLIIVVTGLTGAGKSTFINQYLGKEVVQVGHGMWSCTEKVKSVVAMLPESHPTWPNRRLVLVDTPGFDDTNRSDLVILKNVATWLASTYDKNTKIIGLVYLFDITKRMGGTALLNCDIFKEICGPNALSRVVMATTHWGETIKARQKRQTRLEELKRDFWRGFLACGAIHMVVPGPDHEDGELENNVNDIIEYILQKQMSVVTEVQQELVDLKKRVRDTKAGQKVINTLKKRLEDESATPSLENAPPREATFGQATGDNEHWEDVKAREELIDDLQKGQSVPAIPCPHSPANAPIDKPVLNYELDDDGGDPFFDAHPDDLIILVMGLTGAGKSTFINRFGGEDIMAVAHGLRSCTRQIEVAKYDLPPTHQTWPGRRLILVDTPGFDDTFDGEYEILRRIALWLAKVYKSEVKVTGIIYLHSIGHNRVCGSSLLSHNIFRSICGPGALNNVVMATTQWDTISTRNKAAGPIREAAVKDLWRESLNQGAVYMRVEVPEDDPRRDTQRVIDYILQKHAVATRIQEELVDLNKRLKKTEAAQTLAETLERWLGDTRTQELSEEKEEELKKFPVEPGFVDWVKGLFRQKRSLDPARVTRL